MLRTGPGLHSHDLWHEHEVPSSSELKWQHSAFPSSLPSLGEYTQIKKGGASRGGRWGDTRKAGHVLVRMLAFFGGGEWGYRCLCIGVRRYFRRLSLPFLSKVPPNWLFWFYCCINTVLVSPFCLVSYIGRHLVVSPSGSQLEWFFFVPHILDC